MTGEIEILSAREHHDEEEDDAGVVGLVRFTAGVGGHGPINVNVDYLAAFVEQLRDMSWDEVTLYLRENDIVLAHEKGQEHNDIFAALAPIVPDGEEDDD